MENLEMSQITYKTLSKNKKKKLTKVEFDQRTVPETADEFIVAQSLDYKYDVTLSNSENLYRDSYVIKLRYEY